MNRRVEGLVLHRRCQQCGAEHYDFEFSGDTDMATEGLVAATRPGLAVVGVREARSKEWAALCRNDAAVSEAAFQRAFGETGWRIPVLRRWEERPGGQMRSVHACFACAEGECLVVEKLRKGAFEQRGGRVLFDDDLWEPP